MKKNPVLYILYTIKTILLLAWIVISSFVLSVICIFLGIFSKKIGYFIAKIWATNLAFFSGIKVITRGKEKIDQSKNYLFVSNHLSYFDIIVLYMTVPFLIGFIARKNLFYIPFWGWALLIAGHIPIDRSNPKNASKSIKKACELINKYKRSIIGFPEGTRSKSGEMAPFKLGLFSLAIKAGIDIVPVALHRTREILKPGSLFIHPGTVYVDLATPISIQGYTKRDKSLLADKTWKIIHDLVEKEKK